MVVRVKFQAAAFQAALESTLVEVRVRAGNRNKGKGNSAGLAWESQSHCFKDEFGIPYTHPFGIDTLHDYSQGNCRTMSSIINKLE